MKNQGLTMLQIVITVVVMLILASVAILYGRGIPREARITSIYHEIREVESAIKEGHILSKIKEKNGVLDFYGELSLEKEDDLSQYRNVLGGSTTGTYYKLDFTTSKKLEDILDVENVDHDYLLDFENMNIYLIEGIDLNSGDETVMTYDSEAIERYYNNVFNK